jgi:hypothetical protein
MTYACIDIEIEDYLYKLPTETLRLELKSRKDAKPEDSPGAPHEWTPIGMADDLRTAFYARNASRFEALLAVLDPA